MVLVQVLGGDQLQDGVAQVFETLVVSWRDGRIFIRKRAVRDGL